MRLACLVLCSACGRIAFDELGPTESPDAPIAPPTPSVQRGSITLPAGVTFASAPIDPIDPGRSLVVMSHGIDSPAPDDALARIEIVDGGTNVKILRAGTGAPTTSLEAAFQVITWAGWSVRPGVTRIAPGETEVLVPLGTTVDLAHAFAIATHATVGNAIDEDDMLLFELASGDQLRLALANDQANDIEVSWQVIEIPDARVIAGRVPFAASDDFQTPTTPSFDPARSWLVYSVMATDLTTSASPYAVSGEIASATSLHFERGQAGGVEIEVAYAVIELAEGTVSRAVEPVQVGVLTNPITVPTFDPTRAFVFGGGFAGKGGRSTYNADRNQGTAWARFDLAGTDTISLTRRRGDTAAAIPWQLIDLAPP